METALSPARGPGTRRAALAVALAVVLGSGLRLWAATSRSLWLDEFHSLHHALAAGPAALLASLQVDNHPPGSFLVLQAWAALAGDGQVALRLPAVVYSALAIWLAARTAGHLAPGRPLAAPVAAPVAGAVAAGAGLAVLLGAEIRMYALLALCVVGLAEAVSAWCAARERDAGAALPWRAAAFVAIGLLTHYWFLHHLALFGLAALASGAGGAGPRWRVRDAAPLAVGVALALPWYATGFRQQLTGHDLWPGGSGVEFVQVAQSYLVLLFVNLGTLPPALKLTLAAAGAGLLALAGFGAAAALARERGPRRAAVAAVAANAFLIGPWGAAVALAFPRAGFNWSYLAGAVPALAVLVGLGAVALRPALRAPLLAPLLAALFVGAVTQARSPGTENLRGAVRHVLAIGEPGDAVLPVEWQPPFFPHGQAWAYYARGAGDDLLLLDHGEHYDVAALPSPPPPRVHVVRRGLPLDAPLLATLRARYRREDAAAFGYGVSVQTFSDPR